MVDKKRVLFVDDDTYILQGLRRRLSSLGKEWETAFAESGSRALELLAATPFDVVISDMRMPGMDGAQLLERVKTLYPRIARIVLSGQSDQETVMRAVGPAHQYLSKPCNTEYLRAAVERTCAMRDYLSDRRITELVGSMTYLPALPTLFSTLSEELHSEHASLERVAEIISGDIGMTAKILQLVNSEFFGLSQRMVSAKQAVNYLGLETIRSLLLTFNVFSGATGKQVDPDLCSRLWMHSLAVGVCARQIVNSEGMGREMADEAFTGGLLHDVGKLVIAVNFPEQSREIERLVVAGECSWSQAERDRIGMSHAEVGAYLLSLWGLPDSIVELAAFHSVPSKCLNQGFTALTAVHVADRCHRRMSAANARATDDFDRAYLEDNGLSKRLDNWITICEVTVEERLSQDLRRLLDTVQPHMVRLPA